MSLSDDLVSRCSGIKGASARLLLGSPLTSAHGRSESLATGPATGHRVRDAGTLKTAVERKARRLSSAISRRSQSAAFWHACYVNPASRVCPLVPPGFASGSPPASYVRSWQERNWGPRQGTAQAVQTAEGSSSKSARTAASTGYGSADSTARRSGWRWVSC